MKQFTLSALVAGVALLAGQAHADLVFPGGACATAIDHDFPVVLDGTASIGGDASEDVVLTCPVPKTNNSTAGIASGTVRVRATNANLSSCAMRALTQYGSVLSGQSVAITTVNQPVYVNVGDSVTAGAMYGYYALSCALSGGSRLYGYRYREN